MTKPLVNKKTRSRQIAFQVKELVEFIQKHRMNYDAFNNVCKLARKKLGMKSRAKKARLPRLLTDEELDRLFELVEEKAIFRDRVMMRILFYSGLRVSECANLKIEDVNLKDSQIFVAKGKGDKDRTTLFFESYKPTLRGYIETLDEDEIYLFPTKFRRAISARRIQQIVKEYGKQAGVYIHPHLFRHQVLTLLTKQGMDDRLIQQISGHANQKTLQVYQHLSLKDAKPAYMKAMKKADGDFSED